MSGGGSFCEKKVTASGTYSIPSDTLSSRSGRQKTGRIRRVINVEINVRAYKNKQLVSNLTPRDLQLFENVKPLQITSMTEVHRKIGTQQLGLEQGAPPSSPSVYPVFLDHEFIFSASTGIGSIF